jgi:ATP synthase protein I
VPKEPPQSPLSVGVFWASRITSLALEFTLPVLAGIFLDKRLGSLPLATILGAVLGMTVGMMHVLQIARGDSGTGPGTRPEDGKGERGK